MGVPVRNPESWASQSDGVQIRNELAIVIASPSVAAPVPTRKVGIMEQNEGPFVASKQQERLAFLLLTAVIFPLATVLIVAGYGFLVWMWQLLYAGPPTGH